MKRSRKLGRPAALQGLLSRSYSMMSLGVTRAGASACAMRYRSGAEGWRIDTWPKPSTTPCAARIRLAAARSATRTAGTFPPAFGAVTFLDSAGGGRFGFDMGSFERCFRGSDDNGITGDSRMPLQALVHAHQLRREPLEDLRLRLQGAEERRPGDPQRRDLG